MYKYIYVYMYVHVVIVWHVKYMEERRIVCVSPLYGVGHYMYMYIYMYVRGVKDHYHGTGFDYIV